MNKQEEQMNYSITVARTIEEVEALRPVWEKMQWHPNADIDFYLLILTTRSEIASPYVIQISLNEQPQVILVGRLEYIKLKVRFGYKNIYLPKIRLISIIHGGILGNIDSEICMIIINQIRSALLRNEADAVLLNQIDRDSELFHLANKAISIRSRDFYPKVEKHWRMLLPKSYDEFIASRSRNFRHNIRRCINQIQKDFGTTFTVEHFSEIGHIDRIMQDAELITRKTYHRGLNVGFKYNDENRNRFILHAKRGIMLSFFLYHNEMPISFFIGMVQGDTYYPEFTSYDPDYKKYNTGTYLLLNIVERFCREQKIKIIDFGFGEAEYKHSYCDDCTEEASIYIFSCSFKGVLTNMIRTVILCSSNIAEFIMRKMNLKSKVKRIWRNKLSGR